MAQHFPALRVDHVSIAVREIAPALALLRRILPVRMRRAPGPGYDDQFVWTDFYVGDWKLELIESARPGSFVERFLARRGEGMHHLSIDVEEGALDAYTAQLERDGLRIAERGDYGGGDKTAFISPRTAPGILVQFWQVPGFRGAPPEDHPTEPTAALDGVRFRVDHVSLAVRSIDAALAWFRRAFPVDVPRPKRPGWDGTHHLLTFWLAGYKMELIEPAGEDGFVARFLARRGEGFHHLAIDVDRLDPLVDRLERDGMRLVGKSDIGGGRKTAFIHPRDAHGVLIQFWQEPEFGGPRRT
jgi:methylmalonyl-CoA/ethylmalonyl-CoA epimerase